MTAQTNLMHSARRQRQNDSKTKAAGKMCTMVKVDLEKRRKELEEKQKLLSEIHTDRLEDTKSNKA